MESYERWVIVRVRVRVRKRDWVRVRDRVRQCERRFTGVHNYAQPKLFAQIHSRILCKRCTYSFSIITWFACEMSKNELKILQWMLWIAVSKNKKTHTRTLSHTHKICLAMFWLKDNYIYMCVCILWVVPLTILCDSQAYSIWPKT